MDNLKSAMDVGISRGKYRYGFIVCLFQRDLVICKHLARWNGNSQIRSDAALKDNGLLIKTKPRVILVPTNAAY